MAQDWGCSTLDDVGGITYSKNEHADTGHENNQKVDSGLDLLDIGTEDERINSTFDRLINIIAAQKMVSGEKKQLARYFISIWML